MGLREFFLWQLEHEVATSRKVIERVPEGRNSWKPHERSMELGYLAALVASMPGWIEFMVNRRELNLSDPANDVMRTKPVRTRAELCHMLAMGLARSRKARSRTMWTRSPIPSASSTSGSALLCGSRQPNA